MSIGRDCENCGETYLSVVQNGPSVADAQRSCGCPATVEDVAADVAEDEEEREGVAAYHVTGVTEGGDVTEAEAVEVNR